MKRSLIFIFSFCVAQLAYSQKEILSDSISASKLQEKYRNLTPEKPQFFMESFPPEGLLLIDKSLFNQPLIPEYSKNIDFKKYFTSDKLIIESGSFTTQHFSPFLYSGNIFNQATYQVNDRFSFGGNSFGAQTIFDKPKLNPAIQDMNVKGASMFMQYKISKSIKVETRVSISNRSNPWEP